MIEKSAFLTCSPSRAFELFTERASDWWPAEVRHTPDPRSEIRMIPTGRFWERARDGHEVELGRVLVWEPPERLMLDFYPGTDALHPTEVIVRFAGEADGTRVVVEHRPKAESAELWAAGAPRFERSWDIVLPALQEAAR
jgi:Activator of Hsp90 ATPase homolog 1-like protein